MLTELRITSLGVIEESVLELGPGFTAITGETGAGKTMVVTALGLLLGGRATADIVRTGARAARVEGVVRAGHALADAVEEAGGEVEDGHVLLVRQVSTEGRSRAYAGGAAVPASTLAGLADPMVAVHGQSDQHRLLRPGAQRDALDRYAGAVALDLRAEFGELYAALRSAEAELAEVTATRRERAREADLLRSGLEEVAAVAPQPGEDAALAAEEARLGHADTLRTAALQARESLSATEGGPDALTAVAVARTLLDRVRGYDPAADALAERVAEAGYLLTDLAAEVASYATGLESDPLRLAAVSERRSALQALTRRYADTVEEVLAWAEHAAARLAELDDTGSRVHALTARCGELRGRLADVGTALSSARRRAAASLGTAMTRELHALAMPHATVTVSVRQAPAPAADPGRDPGRDPDRDPGGALGGDGLDVGGGRVRFGPTGLDDVELLLAANVGGAALPLHRSASGGERSRVMLALEVALAGTDPVPTMVFDEVDAGVGGRAAVEVGRRLAALAEHAQVLVVTHLPQVAAFADRHVVVAKSDDGTVTTSGLRPLDDAARVSELSRMLAGLEDSATAVAHAEELLVTARRRRGAGGGAVPGGPSQSRATATR
jgi:DNA repair protein RecN (Recombination protein N)